jgi:hypothetical protein
LLFKCLASGILFFCALFICGCSSSQSSKNLWKDVKGVYTTYINTPASLDLDHGSYCKPHELALVEAMAEVDFQLDLLARAMDDSDRSPDDEWGRAMLASFPWLSGIVVADGGGSVMWSSSAGAASGINWKDLLQKSEGRRQTELRARVLDSARGPEIILAKPVYMRDTPRAVIVSRFNPHDLLIRTGKPEKFVLYAEKKLLWPSVYRIDETPLKGADWTSLGASSVDGRLKNSRGEFYWLSTYLADLRLFYSLPVSGDFSVNARQLDVLGGK